MVCTFDKQKQLYIKVLRQETIEHQVNINSIYSQTELSPFLPLYFDNDYSNLQDMPKKSKKEEVKV